MDSRISKLEAWIIFRRLVQSSWKRKKKDMDLNDSNKNWNRKEAEREVLKDRDLWASALPGFMRVKGK